MYKEQPIKLDEIKRKLNVQVKHKVQEVQVDKRVILHGAERIKIDVDIEWPVICKYEC